MLSEWMRREYHHRHGHGYQQGKRKRGRPRMTLRRTVQRDMQTGNISRIDLNEKATDQADWRVLLSVLCT